jgi:hypothetical protein
VRADNAIRMGGGVCTDGGGKRGVECGLGPKHARVPGCGAADCRSRDGEGVRVVVGGGVDGVCTLYRRREVRLYTDGGREGG